VAGDRDSTEDHATCDLVISTRITCCSIFTLQSFMYMKFDDVHKNDNNTVV